MTELLSFFWLEHQASLIVFLLVIFGIAVSNSIILGKMKLGRYPLPAQFPRVSVMVPVRNEERTIARCLQSLLTQDYPDFEVIVLDDQSTDRSAMIIDQFKSAGRLKILKGNDLPAGWFGKHWACHQLAAVASGEFLVFTDADTWHHPWLLRDAVAAQVSEQADLLTCLPREQAVTMGEKLIIPVMPFAIIGFLSLFFAHRLRWSAYSATVGQFMMFRRSTFERIGGYQSVKHKQVDDMALGQHIKKLGYRLRLADGQDRIVCRMYTNFKDACSGFGKTVFGAFNHNIPAFTFVWLWLFVLSWQPLIVFGIKIAGGPVSTLSLLFAAGAVLVWLALWGMALYQFHFPLWLTPCYPLVFFLTLIIALYSMINSLVGTPTWKGRRI